MQESTSFVSVEEEWEPRVTSDDPNERKLARKLRMERRWGKTNRRQSIDGGNTEAVDEEETPTPIQAQLQKSGEILRKLIYESDEYITNIRVANESREVNRREDEGIARENIIKQLEEECEKAKEMFDEIAEKWTSIKNHDDPLHIDEEIMNQKAKCELLLSQKDGIIAMLKDEIMKAERTFNKDQRKQMEDIDTLTRRIEKQTTFLRHAYGQELEMLEGVILTERKLFIEASNKRWEDLFKKRETQEIAKRENQTKLLNDFNTNMDNLRIEFQEHYRATKINLQNDLSNLQQEYQEIKGLTMINNEKFDYNYQILKKREDENVIVKSQQKRRMNKLQDMINSLRKKIATYESTTTNQINKLTGEIKNLHKRIMDVEAKADHFALVNDEKFHQVWTLNENNVVEVLKNILETDRILYEQQLGLEWEKPVNSFCEKTELPSFKNALTLVDPKYLGEFLKYRIEDEQTGFETQKEMPENRVYRALVKHLMIKIADKSGFLTDEKLKVLLKPYETYQGHLVKLENVFGALGIRNQNYIGVLVKHFAPYCYCYECQGHPIHSRKTAQDSPNVSMVSSMKSHKQSTECITFEVPELQAAMATLGQSDEVVIAILDDIASKEELFVETDIGRDVDKDNVDEEDITNANDKRNAGFSRVNRPINTAAATNGINFTHCEYNHTLVISSVYVLRALNEFIAEFYSKSLGMPTMRSRLDKKRYTISRCLSEEDIQKYWGTFKKTFTEDRLSVWDGLLEGLKRYHEILKERKTVCEEVMKLRRENADLKRLLANYIDHGPLMVPPCANERQEFLKTALPLYTNYK